MRPRRALTYADYRGRRAQADDRTRDFTSSGGITRGFTCRVAGCVAGCIARG